MFSSLYFSFFPLILSPFLPLELHHHRMCATCKWLCSKRCAEREVHKMDSKTGDVYKTVLLSSFVCCISTHNFEFLASRNLFSKKVIEMRLTRIPEPACLLAHSSTTGSSSSSIVIAKWLSRSLTCLYCSMISVWLMCFWNALWYIGADNDYGRMACVWISSIPNINAKLTAGYNTACSGGSRWSLKRDSERTEVLLLPQW